MKTITEKLYGQLHSTKLEKPNRVQRQGKVLNVGSE